MAKRIKYALIGASYRAVIMFAEPLLKEQPEHIEFVGIFDINPLRIEAVKKMAGLTCPSYTDFDQMIRETKPDCGIVTTVDRFHDKYIVGCLEAGVNAITEKR